MKVFRRRLASCALTLIAVQLALLFATPTSACCKRPGAAAAGAQIAADDEAPDCCPPGAHRDGECPLHRGASSEARGAKRATHCRMTCGNTTSPQILLGAIGVLPVPAAFVVPFAPSAMPAIAAAPLSVRPSVPDAPPPELL
jgi:hypothetical protein